MGREGSYDEKSMLDNFEAWQSMIVSGEDEVNKKLVSKELIAIQDCLFNEKISSGALRCKLRSLLRYGWYQEFD